jgi:hypothetical protein
MRAFPHHKRVCGEFGSWEGVKVLSVDVICAISDHAAEFSHGSLDPFAVLGLTYWGENRMGTPTWCRESRCRDSAVLGGTWEGEWIEGGHYLAPGIPL